MKLFPMALGLLLVAGCGATNQSLTEARQGFTTSLVPQASDKSPAETAPSEVFSTIKYPAPSGQLTAYISPDPHDGYKRPAIVWITGGDCNSIGDVWSDAPRDNDQTAAAFRKAGVLMMFPSLRGGNDNPGQKEGFLGEVDDVLAATKYLAAQPYIDPKRIYLGGHSTGGTLALLVAESSPQYRATFAFGPVDDVSGYGTSSGFLPFDLNNSQEVRLRSPGYWLNSVKSPVWVLEGTAQGNIESLRAMARGNSNPNLHFLEINGATHFTSLAPTNEIIAQKVVADTGPTCNISLTAAEVSRSFGG